MPGMGKHRERSERTDAKNILPPWILLEAIAVLPFFKNFDKSMTKNFQLSRGQFYLAMYRK